MTGKVVWFSNALGYGFISRDGGGADVFAHHTDIIADGYRKLDAGAAVKFDTEVRDGKTVAINIHQQGEGHASNSTATR